VILNGASSAGKTSIATAFREQRADADDFWLAAGIDDVLTRLSFQYVDVGWPSGPGDRADDGLRIVTGESGARLQVGPLLRRLLRHYQEGVARAATAGCDVIVDEVVLDRVAWCDWQETLEGFDVLWVAVRCSLDIMEERERLRGDRPLGLARAQLEVVHEHARYDLDIDTTFETPEVASARIGDIIANN
jgi:chloramphenicol 3-O phosphotransferase